MHVLMTLLVDTDNAEKAMGLAAKVLDSMVDLGDIEYWEFIEGSPVLSIQEADEKGILKDTRLYMWTEFKRYITKVRTLLKYFSDEELFNEKPSELNQVALSLSNEDDLLHDIGMLQYYCRRLGGASPTTYAVIWVDTTGSYTYIINGAEFDSAVREAAYVVFADVHI